MTWCRHTEAEIVALAQRFPLSAYEIRYLLIAASGRTPLFGAALTSIRLTVENRWLT